MDNKNRKTTMRRTILIQRFVGDIKGHYKYALYSARAQLKAEVAGSYLNWVWWILQPFCMMVVYAIVFGFIFGAREEYFTAFIFIGISVWDFFNRNIKQSIKLIKNSKSIISKVYMPKFILILSKMLVNGFKMMISFSIVIILMLYYKVSFSFNIFLVLPLLLDLWLFTFGCMCILTHFGVFVEDLSNVIDIVLKFVFYMTGVMYSISHRIGDSYPIIATIMEKWNPIAFVMASMRECMLYQSIPSVSTMLIWLAISIVICCLGILVIYKNENSYVKMI